LYISPVATGSRPATGSSRSSSLLVAHRARVSSHALLLAAGELVIAAALELEHAHALQVALSLALVLL